MLASQILLWIAVLVLGTLVAALARQVGILHERIAPAGALTLHQKLTTGDPAPMMELPALSGETLVIGGQRASRSQLIFFVSPDCPVCKSLLPVFKSAARAESDWLDVVLASDGDEPAQRRMILAHRAIGRDEEDQLAARGALAADCDCFAAERRKLHCRGRVAGGQLLMKG